MSQFLRSPVNYIAQTQGYRPASNPKHNGIDLGWNASISGKNPPILAAANGVVAAAGTDGAKGVYAVVRSDKVVEGKLVYTLYWHLHTRTVSAGQAVTMGDQIGLMGNTGLATGVHLHFETWITPTSYLNWRLSDRMSYVVDPHTLVYKYADQTIYPSDVSLFNHTDKTLSEGIADGKSDVDVKTYTGTVTALAGLNVRSGSAVTFPKVGYLKRGTVVKIVANTQGWGQLDSGGWVCLKYIKLGDGSDYTTYKVVKGDTLWDIAKRYGTTYQKIAAYSGITEANLICVGQTIKIPIA